MKKVFIVFLSITSIFTNAQNVGIGVANPQNKLHVGGGFRLDTLTGVGGTGLVRHDANGVLYGIKFSGNTNDVLRGDGTFGTYNINGNIGWLLNGNNGTNPATNFLGTTDNQPLLFRVNNIRNGYIGNGIFFGSNAGLSNTSVGTIAIGNGALQKNVSTFYGAQIAIGDSSLFNFNNPQGGENTAVGARTLYSNTVGSGNAAFGVSVLEKNINGIGNNSFGNYSLYKNIQGNSNSAFGNYVLFSNVSGNYNTGVGYDALHSNTTGYENTAVGSFSLNHNNGYYNSAFGSNSLYDNISGHDNTAVGYAAMFNNQSASFNTSVGAFSMNKTTVGDQNTAVGYKTLEQNISGHVNTAVGFAALQGNKQGAANTAIGESSLNINNGNLNTAVGTIALKNNTTGEHNSGFGVFALYNNSTGSYNTGIGYNSGGNLPSNVSNVTCVGAQTGWLTTSSNQVNIGNFSVTWIGGQTGWFHYSDKRIKKDIKDDVPGLSFITRLKPITYNIDVRKQEELANAGKTETNSELIKSIKNDREGKYDVEKIKMTGFFAQDVEEAAKAINYSFSGVHNPKNGGLYSLDYSAFVVPLVKAVQEQQSIIEKQQKLIDELLKRVAALENK